MDIEQDISLKPFNTFAIDVKARYFTRINCLTDLQRILSERPWFTTPKMVLGGGSNVLFTQDYEGLVLQNGLMGIETIREDDDHIWLKIGAGENWHDFVMHCVKHGYYGVENLALIPGTVGAAPLQNIGAYGVEIKDTFECLDAIRLRDNAAHTFDHAACKFGYRDSVFKNDLKNQYLISNVTLKLNKKPAFHLEYGNLKAVMSSVRISEPTLKNVSDAVIQIRQSKLPDPKTIPNAGSFFKNPIVPQQQFEQLHATYNAMPHYAAADNQVKLAAAWLIDQCGFKGKRFENVGVHDKQALVLVNLNQGEGKAIKQLSEQIQTAVLEKFNVALTPEVNIL